ncbi:MAG: pyridinium-3,5-bisthiocarboxylic acid mononucleotide nickel chelatase [Chthoniobacter sp.]|nr:pyridinium-3,5-bisthiocarboxylic acid mononucleotide nickel chelatase [Chthoniobacter sp.]
MRALFFDCFSGISGDMTVGALCDLGVKPSSLEWELSKLEIGDFHMHFERQKRQHIEGVKFGIHEGTTHRHEQEEPGDDHEHAHSHETHVHAPGPAHDHDHGDECHAHHPPSRTHAQIRQLIEQSELSAFVKQHALGIFQRIAVAEAKIHGQRVEDVAFHEVGALDSIADIVCACAGIEQLGVQKIFFSPLQDGRGWTETMHGRFPVPAPATLEILKDVSIAQVDEPFEMITPTGAAIAAEFAESFGLMPRMKISRIGYGLGSRKSANRPNVLRVSLGEIEEAGGYDTDTITRLETNIDDLSPEITGAVMEKLFAAGALDVFFTPIQMKKNRPGVQLSVLCESSDVQKIANLLFSETTSFGLRMREMQRLKLERRFENVQTPFGEIAVKLGLKNGAVVQAAPEFESCRIVSEKTGQPLRAIYDAARQALQSR